MVEDMVEDLVEDMVEDFIVNSSFHKVYCMPCCALVLIFKALYSMKYSTIFKLL